MPSQYSPPEEIKIWSFNTFLRPPPIKTNLDDFKNERFVEIMNRMDEYDIVCFQQLFQTASFRAEEMIANGIRKGFHYWKISQPTSFCSRPPVDSGLLVMSKLPILKKEFRSFDIGVFSDSASDKGSIYCKIQTKTGIIHLFNLHLQASYIFSWKAEDSQNEIANKNIHLSLSTRRHQWKLLKSFMRQQLKQSYKSSDTVLIIGDFNMNSLEERRQLQKTMGEELINSYEYDRFISAMLGEDDHDYILDDPYSVRDILFQAHGHHPPTYGLEKLMVLTGAHQFGIKQSIDYAFEIVNKNGCTLLEPLLEQCVVDKAQIQGQPFTQLSDHSGLKIVFRNK